MYITFRRLIEHNSLAGKGRSGTMACSYLLTRDGLLSMKEEFESRTEQDGQQAQNGILKPGSQPHKNDLTRNVEIPSTHAVANQSKDSGKALTETLDKLNHVLAWHTSRRMKKAVQHPGVVKVKHGVSIPSQRRWLHYWCRLLENQGPPGFWVAETGHASRPAPKIRLTQIQLRMRTPSGLKTGLVQTANVVLNTRSLITASSRPVSAVQTSGNIWASLARYDDDLVGLLEKWELYTRGENGDMSRRRNGSEQMGKEALTDIFEDGKWDKSKMVRSFARFGTFGGDAIRKERSQVGCCARGYGFFAQLIFYVRIGREDDHIPVATATDS